MHLTIFTSDGGELEIDDFDQASALDLTEAFRAGEPVLTLEVDGGTVLLNAAHVVRIDID